MESIPGVKGRFELVHAGQEFPVIVDYAHTPDGLLNVLETIDEFAEKRVLSLLVVVVTVIKENDRKWRKLL